MKYYIYNSIGFKHEPKNEETKKIKEQIDWSYYYKPEYSMFDMVLSNVEYELQRDNIQIIMYEEWSMIL